ncbi:RNA polymerase sigma factor [Virgibacillus necropolis]|uniref:RNA polymerase subunit sigma-24 n=1 Tax=Virgibacillus necropolis TaxID=163877 RepID=A0A221MFC9_9BACI|nr:RNA polymerase sigma factor [Virgibacillus necropolis]ASN06344.1 RNA polymerase subunit sigma-24 [Virgibacillus necropolis]
MNEMSFQQSNRSNNLEEFKQLYREHKKDVFAMALSILRDFELAEDVLQEVYIKLFQYKKQNEITNVKAWLVSVSRNTALDLYRKKKRELTGFDDGYFERLEYLSEDPLDKMVLAKYLELLDSGERQIVILKDISGMKHKEIAKIVEMPLGTVLWKYRVVLNKLRKALE